MICVEVGKQYHTKDTQIATIKRRSAGGTYHGLTYKDGVSVNVEWWSDGSACAINSHDGLGRELSSFDLETEL